jgi:hypothetical protein
VFYASFIIGIVIAGLALVALVKLISIARKRLSKRAAAVVERRRRTLRMAAQMLSAEAAGGAHKSGAEPSADVHMDQ